MDSVKGFRENWPQRHGGHRGESNVFSSFNLKPAVGMAAKRHKRHKIKDFFRGAV
jgi:hypothetical protein